MIIVFIKSGDSSNEETIIKQIQAVKILQLSVIKLELSSAMGSALDLLPMPSITAIRHNDFIDLYIVRGNTLEHRWANQNTKWIYQTEELSQNVSSESVAVIRHQDFIDIYFIDNKGQLCHMMSNCLNDWKYQQQIIAKDAEQGTTPVCVRYGRNIDIFYFNNKNSVVKLSTNKPQLLKSITYTKSIIYQSKQQKGKEKLCNLCAIRANQQEINIFFIQNRRWVHGKGQNQQNTKFSFKPIWLFTDLTRGKAVIVQQGKDFDLFFVDSQGYICQMYRKSRSKRQFDSKDRICGGKCKTLDRSFAVTRYGNHIDLYYIGQDHRVYWCYLGLFSLWCWTGPTAITPADAWYGVACIRKPNISLDVYYLNEKGDIKHYYTGEANGHNWWKYVQGLLVDVVKRKYVDKYEKQEEQEKQEQECISASKSKQRDSASIIKEKHDQKIVIFQKPKVEIKKQQKIMVNDLPKGNIKMMLISGLKDVKQIKNMCNQLVRIFNANELWEYLKSNIEISLNKIMSSQARSQSKSIVTGVTEALQYFVSSMDKKVSARTMRQRYEALHMLLLSKCKELRCEEYYVEFLPYFVQVTNAYFLILRVKYFEGAKWDYEQEDLDDVLSQFNNYLKKSVDHVKLTHFKKYKMLKMELQDQQQIFQRSIIKHKSEIKADWEKQSMKAINRKREALCSYQRFITINCLEYTQIWQKMLTQNVQKIEFCDQCYTLIGQTDFPYQSKSKNNYGFINSITVWTEISHQLKTSSIKGIKIIYQKGSSNLMGKEQGINKLVPLIGKIITKMKIAFSKQNPKIIGFLSIITSKSELFSFGQASFCFEAQEMLLKNRYVSSILFSPNNFEKEDGIVIGWKHQ